MLHEGQECYGEGGSRAREISDTRGVEGDEHGDGGARLSIFGGIGDGRG